MSRRDGSIYVGRLSKNTRTKDLEEIFEPYGRLMRCDIKYGTEMAYAFIDFEDRRDAEDCVKYENGRELNGQSIMVEWAKGGKDKRLTRRSDSSSQSYDECFRCRRTGHWARDCPDLRWGGRRGGGGGGGGGGGSNRWRSPSPRRRSRSRSRDRKRRSRSRSRDRRKRSRSRERRRSRSRSDDRKRSRSGSDKSRSASVDRKKERSSRSGSRDKKKSPSGSKSRSRSPRRSKSGSKSKSRSKSPVEQLENRVEPQANGNGLKNDGDDKPGEDYGDDDRRSRSGSRD